jgi:hypothetical protein
MDAFVRQVPEMFHFWETQMIQDIIEYSYIDRINPLSGFDGRLNGDLRFRIDGNDTFIDLSRSFIYFKLALRGKATKTVGSTSTDYTIKCDDTNFKETRLSVVNSIVHSIFKSCEVRLGNMVITLADTDYGYTTHFQILINATEESQNSYFQVIGWRKDTEGKLDDLVNNAAFEYRRKNFFTHDDGIGEFIMKPHTGICFLKKVIPPALPIEFTFRRHPNPQFYMMGNDKDITSNWDIEILEAKYDVQRYRTSAVFAQDFEKMLKEHSLLFRIPDSHIHSCTIPPNVANYTNDSLFRGTPPSRIIIAFVATDNYNGSLIKNPYSLHHFHVQSMRLLKNGLDYPVPPIETNFETVPHSFMQAYNRVLLSMGADYNDHSLALTPSQYAKGFFFYSYTMNPDQDGTSDNLGLLPQQLAQIRVDVKFSQNLKHAIQMIVYFESPTIVTVDVLRCVTVIHK